VFHQSLLFSGLVTDALADAGQVQLGRGQESSQLIVQFARQPGTLILSHPLHVTRQLDHLLRAPDHFFVQPVSLGVQLQHVHAPLLLQVAAQTHQITDCP